MRLFLVIILLVVDEWNEAKTHIEKFIDNPKMLIKKQRGS